MIRSLPLLAALLLSVGALADEPLETSLWRSIALGRLESVSAQEVVDYLRGSPDQAGYLLARSALAVAGEPNPFPEWPLIRLLEERLDALAPRACGCWTSDEQDPLPAGFDQAVQLFALVYSLVMTGQGERTTERLGERLERGPTSSRDLAAQALAFIGTAKAKDLLRRYAEVADSPVATNLLGARYFPPMHELAGYQQLIPSGERGREALVELARTGRGDREMLALHPIGLLPSADDPVVENLELDLLRAGTRSGHFGYRHVSTRGLGMRSPEGLGMRSPEGPASGPISISAIRRTPGCGHWSSRSHSPVWVRLSSRGPWSYSPPSRASTSSGACCTACWRPGRISACAPPGTSGCAGTCNC